MAAHVAQAIAGRCQNMLQLVMAGLSARPFAPVAACKAGRVARGCGFGATVDPYLVWRLAGQTTEMVACLYYDGEGAFLAERVHGGDPASVAFDRSMVLRGALGRDVRYAVIAHNHPSGEARPSAADVRATRQVHCLFASLDVRLIDHVIVARGGDIFSFRRAGLI